jgi:hypothetical protein
MGNIAAWHVAHGEAQPVTLPVAATVELAPSDDSIATNTVIISGNGTINSFGPAALDSTPDDDFGTPICITKKVIFQPDTAPIVLTSSPTLLLLGAATRSIATKCIGYYSCDSLGNWTEESFADTTQPPGSGGTGGGIPEAPIDSTTYGRMNSVWARVLAIANDVLDGGNF